jgi:hypothetical protein
MFAGAAPGRVLSVHVTLGDRWQGEAIQPAPGKFVRRQDGSAGGELARITVTLAVAQPLEVGDSLSGEKGATGVVCRIASGSTLTRTLGLTTEPDLVVAPDHPWAPPTDAPGRPHNVLVGPSGGALLAPEAVSRPSGPYAMVSQRPFVSDGEALSAQELTPAGFRWLLERGACCLALELYGPRCDCVDLRVRLFETIAKETGALADLQITPVREWRSLADSPSEGMVCFDLLLRAACVKAVLRDNDLSFRLLTPDEVLAESFGAVTKPELINVRTQKAEPDGLFCERIFGPEKDWECACGKYRGTKYKGMICDRCGVKIARSRVRSRRMGHIELAAPVVHSWFFRAAAGLLAQELGLDSESIDQVIHYGSFVVTDPGASPLQPGQILDEDERRLALERHGSAGLCVETGAEALEALLHRQGRTSALAGAVLRRLPVLPPDLRPLIRLESGNFANSDVNDLYRGVISRNRELRRLLDMNAPQVIIWNSRRNLQRAVEAVLDNDRRRPPVLGTSERALVSLARHLRWLAKRRGTLRDGFLQRSADFSARTRLTAEETPNLDSALLPERFAWDLYQPLLIARLRAIGAADTIKSAWRLIEKRSEVAREALETVCADALMLAAPSAGPWPLLALRLRLTSELALKVHPDLLDRIGWDNLGQRVNLFAVLTTEARAEAVERLLPSRLAVREGPTDIDPPSAFDVGEAELIDELARWAATERSFPLSRADHLLLCAREVCDFPPLPQP